MMRIGNGGSLKKDGMRSSRRRVETKESMRATPTTSTRKEKAEEKGIATYAGNQASWLGNAR